MERHTFVKFDLPEPASARGLTMCPVDAGVGFIVLHQFRGDDLGAFVTHYVDCALVVGKCFVNDDLLARQPFFFSARKLIVYLSRKPNE